MATILSKCYTGDMCTCPKIIVTAFARRFSYNRERVTSLRECLDSSPDFRKRRRQPWIILILVITAFYFIYRYNKIEVSSSALFYRNRFVTQLIKTEKSTIIAAEQTTMPVNTPQSAVDDKSSTSSTDIEKTTKRIKSVHCLPEKKMEQYWEYFETNTRHLLSDFNRQLRQIRPLRNTSRFRAIVIDAPSSRLHIKLAVPATPSAWTFGEIKLIWPTEKSIDKKYPMVEKGGYYRPPNCTPAHKVAILVPYKDREYNLKVFLLNIHQFLINQQLEYQIFVIQQFGYKPFNKGSLFNAGFKEMLKFKSFYCVILHDVDLIPMDDRILYSCPSLPRHMCARVNNEQIKETNRTSPTAVLGGVISMTVEQYQRANGYSNMYVELGAEDNDMFIRLRASGYPVMRYNKTIAHYTKLPHARVKESPDRYRLLATAVDRYKKDGLSDLNYVVISTEFHHLYTLIVVDISSTPMYDYA